jgi:hypothetical protein
LPFLGLWKAFWRSCANKACVLHSRCMRTASCPTTVICCCPVERRKQSLSDLIRGFKGCSAKSLRHFGIFDAWQKGFYEHILRSGEDCASARAYIFENPVRAGLAKDNYAWPFSGSFVFEWREFQPPVAKFVPPYKAAEKRDGKSSGAEQPR